MQRSGISLQNLYLVSELATFIAQIVTAFSTSSESYETAIVVVLLVPGCYLSSFTVAASLDCPGLKHFSF